MYYMPLANLLKILIKIDNYLKVLETTESPPENTNYY
jgi:hypothetical protein